MFHSSADIGSEVWIVLADVLVGFLAIVLLVSWEQQATAVHSPEAASTRSPKPSPSPAPTPQGRRLIQPPAVERLTNELENLRTSQSNRGYTVFAEGFDVHIIFEEALLFKKCEWALNQQGVERLKGLADILWRYDHDIGRIQIEGHADNRPAESCSSLSKLGNIGLPKDNLLLSSFRAMAVQQQLAQMTQDNGQTSGSAGASQPLSPSQQRLAKLEAVGRGDSHPREPDPNDPRNRRIEITVHFIGPGKAQVPN